MPRLPATVWPIDGQRAGIYHGRQDPGARVALRPGRIRPCHAPGGWPSLGFSCGATPQRCGQTVADTMGCQAGCRRISSRHGRYCPDHPQDLSAGRPAADGTFRGKPMN